MSSNRWYDDSPDSDNVIPSYRKANVKTLTTKNIKFSELDVNKHWLEFVLNFTSGNKTTQDKACKGFSLGKYVILYIPGFLFTPNNADSKIVSTKNIPVSLRPDKDTSTTIYVKSFATASAIFTNMKTLVKTDGSIEIEIPASFRGTNQGGNERSVFITYLAK